MELRRASLTLRALGVAALVGGTIAACGSSSSSSASTTAPVTTVTITKPWARTSPASVTTGAAYFIITSPVDDRITSVSVPTSVAAKTELHETVAAGGPNTVRGGGTQATTMGGGMTMQPVDFIDLKALVPFVLQPGGYHVMMLDLVKPLKVGDTIPLTITLQKAGAVTVDVPVLDSAP